MRGRQFNTYAFDRVLADIRDARARGARAVFLVDDNITLNVRRFEALCRAIIDAGLNDIEYIVQAMTSAIANHGATLAPLMRRALDEAALFPQRVLPQPAVRPPPRRRDARPYAPRHDAENRRRPRR